MAVLFKWRKNIEIHMMIFLQRIAFSGNQHSLPHGLSSRDQVKMLMIPGVLVIRSGKQMGTFLNDISGLFEILFKS
jgi:hypothetical protein